MKTVSLLALCVILSWAAGWFAIRAIDQSDRDLRFPPKPIPRSIELFLLGLPLTVAIAVSGNVHQPSGAGLLFGLFIQWTVLGVMLFFLVRAVAFKLRKRRADENKA